MLNLDEFLNRESHYFEDLWVKDGIETASDGVFIVSQKTDKSDSQFRPLTLTNLEHIFKKSKEFFVSKSGIELDSLEISEPAKVACSNCENGGMLFGCSECGGEGKVEFRTDFNDYECKCKTCEKGDICYKCAGEGEVHVNDGRIRILDIEVNYNLLVKIVGEGFLITTGKDLNDRNVLFFANEKQFGALERMCD